MMTYHLVRFLYAMISEGRKRVPKTNPHHHHHHICECNCLSGCGNSFISLGCCLHLFQFQFWADPSVHHSCYCCVPSVSEAHFFCWPVGWPFGSIFLHICCYEGSNVFHVLFVLGWLNNNENFFLCSLKRQRKWCYSIWQFVWMFEVYPRNV